MSDYEVVERRGGGGLMWIGLGVVAVVLALIAGVWLIGRGGGVAGVAEEGPVRIVVSIPPLAWAARELAPDAELTVLAGSGSSAHGSELTPSQVRALAEADLVLLVGLGLDDAARRAVEEHPREGREVVVMEESLELAGATAGGDAEAHGDEEGEAQDHDHGVRDPHAWLDPRVMRVFVGKADAALARATGRASGGATFLQEECDAIDLLYRLELTALPSRTIVCEHHAYGYLARRYGLEVAAVIRPVESGEVTPGDVKAAVDAIRELGVGAIFVEPRASARAAERIAAETGVKVLTLDPLGDGDWPALMRGNLEALAEGLSASAPVRRGE